VLCRPSLSSIGLQADGSVVIVDLSLLKEIPQLRLKTAFDSGFHTPLPRWNLMTDQFIKVTVVLGIFFSGFFFMIQLYMGPL
jgi:hypothetical protein